MRRPHIKLQRQRELRLIRKEEVRLTKVLKELGYEKLAKPIRHGWYLRPVPRDDVRWREDEEAFHEIAQETGKWIWGRNKKHTRANFERAHNAKQSMLRYPGLDWVLKDKFETLTPTAQKMCMRVSNGYSSGWQCYLAYFFRPSFDRAFITHRKVIDHSILQRMDELDQYTFRKGYYKLAYGYSWPGKYVRKERIRKDRRRAKREIQHFLAFGEQL